MHDHRTQEWLRPLRTQPSPAIRLICFPHAGGSATFFRDWAQWMPPGIDFMAVRYPGREGRFSEPFADSIEEMADRVTNALLPVLDVPAAIFGHSMGASIGHEVAIRLEQDHGVVLRRLFVSARLAPRILRPAGGDSGDEALLKRIRLIGGGQTAALDHPELRELLLPVFRADFRITDAYAPGPRDPISSPITGFAGNEDPAVPVGSMQAWSGSTNGPFDLQVFPGDHFYLVPCASALVGALAGRLIGPYRRESTAIAAEHTIPPTTPPPTRL
jgi:pyochelin biosynthesis protein PchC